MLSPSQLYTAFDSDPAPVVGFLRWLAASAGLPQLLRVLDVGCGPGRLLAPLASLRWQVVGMEPEPEFREHAVRAAAELPNARVLPGGFAEIEQVESFDLAVGINSSAAHLLSPGERAGAVLRIFRALAPGGVVLLDLPNFLWILHHYRAPAEQRALVKGMEVTLRRSHEVDVHAATFTTRDEFAVAARVVGEMEHVYGISTWPEWRHHLQEHGFEDLRTYNGYGSRQAERFSGARMLFSARRPS